MEYYSTNGRSAPVSFAQAALSGLADDGGLYMPAAIPRLPDAFWRDCAGLSFVAVAEEVAAVLLAGVLPRPALHAVVRDALTFDAPLVELAPGLHVLELFHGPTLAFKDVGARFMARVFATLRDESAPPLTVLVATSGDTGSAVAQGFAGVPGTRVVLLYPSGKVSRMQEQQLTTVGGNVTALEVAGTFDDCQRMVKAAFRDPALRERLALTSANSINIARLIPQTFYYVYAYAQLRAKSGTDTAPVFSVPSGNFGNLTAGLIAHRMGLPAERFVAATNANDVVPAYLASGTFAPRPSLPTLSSAMDVGDPSNFARVLALYDSDRERLSRDLRAYGFDDAQTLAAIRALYDRYGYVADPHTAVGHLGLMRYREESPGPHAGIVLSTAHPAKFADCTHEALGFEVELPERLRACLDRPKHAIALPADDAALRAFLLEMTG